MADGLTVTLFASEPEVRQPIFCKCDDRGRLWTIQYLQYPNPAGLQRVEVDRFSRTVYDRKPEPPPRGPRGADRITILEDTDHDGRADKVHDFIDSLNLCTGVEFGDGGVYVLQVPYLLFYPDRDRDDRPDGDPEVLLDGFGMEDSQSLANHLTWGPDGWLYGLNGSTTTCRIRGIEFQQGVWRYHPRTKAFELFCEGGGNVYGLTFDRLGELYYSSNGGLFWHALQGGYFEKNFGKHGPLHNPHAYGFLPHVRSHGQTGRPNTGGTIYTGTTFPARFQDAFLCGDFLTHTASWWTLRPKGLSVEATLGGHWLDARDTWFGATDLCLGPDGAMYCSDFHDQRTAHPDPDANWDRSNGRIYRIQSGDAPPATVHVDVAAKPSAELVELLNGRNGWMADRARRILGKRREASLWPQLEHRAVEAATPEIALQYLWALHGSGGLQPASAARLLEHPADRVRAWVIRLLADDPTPTAGQAEVLGTLAREDRSPAVRLQLACSARRWPAALGLDLLDSLVRTAGPNEDPRFDWSCWWGLESFAIEARPEIVRRFATSAAWDHPATGGQLLRLMRRYAAEGTPSGYAACSAIWTARGAGVPASEEMTNKIVEALTLGLQQRPRVSGEGDAGTPRDATAGGLTDSAEGRQLLASIERTWQERPSEPRRIRLALEARSATVYKELLARLKAIPPRQISPDDLAILKDYGRDDCLPVVLPLVAGTTPEPVLRATLSVLRNHPSPLAVEAILTALPSMSSAAGQAAARETLLATGPGSLALLKEVDAGRIAAKEIPVAELGPLEFQTNEEIQRLVRKHWGQIRAATSEEKLAEVRRLGNDLRAGTGDVEAGRLHFRKHCATCHRLHGEGVQLGPDLSGTVKGDLTSLLTSIVDPGAVIRTDYVVQVVVTTSGTVQTGLLAAQDAASLTLVDARNERRRIPRDEIDEWRESPASLMPEKLLSPLAPQELRDLMAFLRTGPAPPAKESPAVTP